MNDIIIKAYESLIGKDFMYVSKHGSETRGTIESITSTYTMSSDKASLNKLAYLVDHSVKGTGKMEKPKNSDSDKWLGYQLEVHVVSTKGIVYNLNEIYILV
jgi:hypothetical protein